MRIEKVKCKVEKVKNKIPKKVNTAEQMSAEEIDRIIRIEWA